MRHNLLLLVFGVVRFFNASTLLLFGEIQAKTFNKHFANLARTGLEIAALAVLGVELKAQRELLGDLGVDLALAKLVQATEHIAILEVAVVALDGLVQDGPSLARTLDARGAPHAQQAEGGIAQRGGNLVEQRSLGALKGIAQLLGAGGGERRQGIEGLPAGLSLGAVECLDQRGHAGHDALRIALGQQVQHAGGKLADTARGAAELLDQTVDGVLVLLCQLKLCQLLVGELFFLVFCHSYLFLLFLSVLASTLAVIGDRDELSVGCTIVTRAAALLGVARIGGGAVCLVDVKDLVVLAPRTHGLAKAHLKAGDKAAEPADRRKLHQREQREHPGQQDDCRRSRKVGNPVVALGDDALFARPLAAQKADVDRKEKEHQRKHHERPAHGRYSS
ncbi:hypothetical protein COLAER_02333 [Collinsella aerofaciens ATCC 25986]|uniref:Uncharacterized protein n=1 Tax=Collinsella aerofaciens (strain ATCC 25986 / DSM 3979 / JCM 10188 / KCTC 3647 / NCTC 11838 / VPI 1003) TaxID=411903 RepID=A4ECZ0_COLAA|nr:hypothetical protein COLAER_02333 [Collinsella aerofaciens ATCC 25986]